MPSFLSLFDIESNAVTTLLETNAHIEAPNWTPDGENLIVNGGGRLFEVALDHPELKPIDTGSHQALNNDHGISPDGQTLVISDKTETPHSCIYLLPRSGGQPHRVTQNTPSWWHGWSPDGARLAYTVVREDQFGIATCRLDGSDETVLVTSPHHYDGPDYTPDGAWIWFNSDRGGSMQLWRMKPDGSNLDVMTQDARDAWFPHPDPNGNWVLYLTYPEATAGHPADCDVDLRLFDVAERTSQVLLFLRGGQGTLNVPCWSPDGSQFAFMRYAREVSKPLP